MLPYYVVDNADNSMALTDNPPDMGGPSSFGTPTRQGNYCEMPNGVSPDLFGSGSRVNTPTRQENRPMLNMATSHGPSKAGAPVTTPTCQENHPMVSMDVSPGPLMFGPPIAAHQGLGTPRQVYNEVPGPSSSSRSTIKATRQSSSPQTLPTYVILQKAQAMGVVPPSRAFDRPVTPPRARQANPPSNKFDTDTPDGQKYSDTTPANQKGSGSLMANPPHQETAPSMTTKVPPTSAFQEDSGAPVATPTHPETAPAKTTKVPSSRKILTPAKPKSAAPKTTRPKTQKPDNAYPKTPKRRPSSSHPRTPKSKMPKTETPQNSSPLNGDKTTIRQISLSLDGPSPARTIHQPTTLWAITSPASLAATNSSPGISSSIQVPGAQQLAVPEVVAPFARNGINDLFPARLHYPQESSAKQPSAQQGVNSTIQQASAQDMSVQQAAAPTIQKVAQQPTVLQPVTSIIQQASPQQPSIQQAVTPIGQQAYAQFSEYPDFRDGDVLIMSPTDKAWKLHSTILINASPVIKRILAKYPAAHITKSQREEGWTIKWKLVMIDEPDAAHVDPDGLTFKTFKIPDRKGHISSFEMPRNANGLCAKPQYNKLYDNFFKCLYNINPNFTNDPNDPEAREYITKALTLIEAAQYLEAIPAVRVAVEANLLRLNTVLWNHICSRPDAWVHAAARLQSPLIFREAMLHIVGCFHLRGVINEELLEDLDGKHGVLGRQVWGLIVRKAKELKDKKLLVERHLLEYYPDRMLHKEGESSIPGRAIYSEDIYLWQALMIFRQFCASACLSNYHHRANDSGLAFYRNIASGNYLRPETLDSFYEIFAMTPKGKQRLAQVLDLIKGDMKPIVKDLLVDRTQGDRGRNALPLDHLTCVEILEEEFPWHVAPIVETNGDVQMSGAM